MWSITRVFTGPLAEMSLRPSCSLRVVKKEDSEESGGAGPEAWNLDLALPAARGE
jgi:hypothetical protein